MSLLKEREIARKNLVVSINNMFEVPLLFGVGKYNGLYHGNKYQAEYSKSFKKRKSEVVGLITRFKKIEKICFMEDILSRKHRTDIEDVIADSEIYRYKGYAPPKQIQIFMDRLKEEIKTEFNKDK